LGTGETLQATGAATYVWSPATGLDCTDCATPVANPTSNIIYTVIGRSAEGCEARDEVNVTVQFPFEMSTAVGDTICAGASVRLEARGAYAYTWYPSTGLNNANIASPIATPNTTTQYMVVGRDDKNCFTDTAYVPIRVYPVPTVDAGEDVTINAGQMVDLMPRISSDVTNVTWSPSGSTFRSNYPGITVKPRETTTFTVDVTNSGGCMARDRVVVHVICNGANVFVPNTFSPNNDGSNDVFYPRGTGLFRIKSAKIFNRWGEIVYQRNDFTPNDAQAGWDGTYKGRPLSPDVYVYLIEVMCDNNTILPLKGNVALIR
jgi:gliding motility-associated-like protein